MKTIRCWRAEEGGLVTIVADAAAVKKKRPSGACVRVRLNPPRKLLREDGQVFDLDAALTFAATHVIEPLAAVAEWTDTVTGLGRLTVSFVTKRAASARSAAKRLDVKPYTVENIERIASARERLEDLFFLTMPGRTQKAGAKDATISKALKKSPGSFAKRAGLDTPKLQLKKVLAALRWLGGEAGKLGVGIYINAHPQQRRFDFVPIGDEDIGTKTQEALARYFDFTLESARRIPGLLWKANRLTSRMKNVEIAVDN